MRTLHVRRLILWPRFQQYVQEELGAHPPEVWDHVLGVLVRPCSTAAFCDPGSSDVVKHAATNLSPSAVAGVSHSHKACV